MVPYFNPCHVGETLSDCWTRPFEAINPDCLEAPTSHVGHMPAGWVPRPPSEDRVAGPYESTAGYRLIS